MSHSVDGSAIELDWRLLVAALENVLARGSAGRMMGCRSATPM